MNSHGVITERFPRTFLLMFFFKHILKVQKVDGGKMKKYNNLLCFGWVGLAKSIFPFLLREILLQGFSKISNERPGYQMDSFGQNF